ncbi:hypothetical protein GCM10009677_44060 [Sphaerisporangium rubeum]|uniref:Uncharacterized protein n=1 Tax=Sphaerisporangium rubeum TaxID=321317 RepID=A0A7X0M3X2_9ACTN|nr:hypothetical protein [Sphaerisporangium rubeum]MBB6471078.1 hypothetical protein [Sphaerisporangium rubeum]
MKFAERDNQPAEMEGEVRAMIVIRRLDQSETAADSSGNSN